MESTGQIRIDKWLWAVRVYKTRQLATDACRAGKVDIAGVKVKASRIVKIGDVVIACAHDLKRTIKAVALTDKRVGPKRVEEFMEDLTPESEIAEARERREHSAWVGEAGKGRPTKKDRRAVERFFAS